MRMETKIAVQPQGYFHTSEKRLLDLKSSLASFSNVVAIGGLSLLLGACATVFDGQRPTLTIRGEPSAATAIDEGSNTKLGDTPVGLHRRPVAIRIRLEHSDCTAQTFRSGRVFNRTAIWNLFNPIGWLIDLASGHIWKFEPNNLQYALNCNPVPEPTPPVPEPMPPVPEPTPPVPEPTPPPDILVSPNLSSAELSAIYAALADLAERLKCPKAIPSHWKELAQQTAVREAGQQRHFAAATLAQAIEEELEEEGGRAVERLCQQPNEVIAQCSDLLEKTPTVTLSTSEPPDLVFFNFDQAKLRGVDEKRLRDLALAVESARGVFGLLLTGFTDPIGTNRYNLNLGCRRARAVKAALAAAGLRRDLILVRTLGKDPTYQLAPGKGGSAHSAKLNRRVTIQLIPFGSGVDNGDNCGH